MPHIIVKLYSGRNKELKTELADNIAKAVSETLNLDIGTVSVSIEEVQKEDWEKTVYNTDILDNKDKLYKKPNYKF